MRSQRRCRPRPPNLECESEALAFEVWNPHHKQSSSALYAVVRCRDHLPWRADLLGCTSPRIRQVWQSPPHQRSQSSIPAHRCAYRESTSWLKPLKFPASSPQQSCKSQAQHRPRLKVPSEGALVAPEVFPVRLTGPSVSAPPITPAIGLNAFCAIPSSVTTPTVTTR